MATNSALSSLISSENSLGFVESLLRLESQLVIFSGTGLRRPWRATKLQPARTLQKCGSFQCLYGWCARRARRMPLGERDYYAAFASETVPRMRRRRRRRRRKHATNTMTACGHSGIAAGGGRMGGKHDPRLGHRDSIREGLPEAALGRREGSR